jgi:hypothetical protein
MALFIRGERSSPQQSASTRSRGHGGGCHGWDAFNLGPAKIDTNRRSDRMARRRRHQLRPLNHRWWKQWRLAFTLLVDDARTADVVRNKTRIALLSVTVCEPLLLRPESHSGDILFFVSGAIDLGQPEMDVGRCRYGHGIPARRWCFRVAHDPQHVLERSLTSRADLLKHGFGALVERSSGAPVLKPLATGGKGSALCCRSCG